MGAYGMTTNDKFKVDLESLAKEQELYENPLTEKQKHILEAAEKLFADFGYSDTSTASIAKEAGVTEKTLFKHFRTKRDLLRRVLFPLLLKTIVPLQLKLVRKILQANYSSYREFYESLAVDRWNTARTLGPKLKLAAVEFVQNDSMRKQIRDLALTHIWPELVRNVERYQEAGELRSDVSAEDIARLQLVTISGNAILRGIIAPDKDYDDNRDAKIVADLLFKGILKR
jgi:TetR/AcrR family transcriptional regulator